MPPDAAPPARRRHRARRLVGWDVKTTIAATAAALTPTLLLDLLPEWQRSLRAENKSPGTIDVYLDGARRYLRWCQATERVPMSRASLHTWTGHLFDHGAAPGTVRTRQLAVKRLTAWLLATEQLLGDPFVGIKGPCNAKRPSSRSATTNYAP
jgi:hypothetical protein